MADNRKRNTGARGAVTGTGKKPAARSAPARSGKKPAAAVPNSYGDEITILTTLVISVLLVLSNFNLCGEVFGPFISKVFFGIFGVLAYLFPLVLFIGVAFYISNRGNSGAMRKLYSSIAMFLVLTALLQLLKGRFDSAMKIMDYYNLGAKEKMGGGLIGGSIVKLFCSVFGEIGAYVIVLGGLVLLFMLITEKFIFAGLSRKSARTMEQLKEKRRIHQEELELAYERGDIPRKKAKTFTFPKMQKEPEVAEEKTVPAAEPLKTEEKPAPLKSRKSNKNQKTEEKLPVYEEELLHKFSERKAPSSYFDSLPFEVNVSGMFEDPEPEEALKQTAFDLPVEEPSIKKEALTEPSAVKEPVIEPFYPEDLTKEEAPKREEEPEMIKAVPEETLRYNKNDRIESDKIVSEKANMAAEVDKNLHSAQRKKSYVFPSLDLLKKPNKNAKGMSGTELKATAAKLQSTLNSFGVHVTVTNVSCGPTVTRYELQPEQGVKVSRITGLADDIKLNLAAADIRIEAPIPGKAAVGIEVPNSENATVMLRELLESKEFLEHNSSIAFAVGKDIGGQTVVTDIGKMPHLLIAGATGSGKSVCINTLIMSIIYKADPDDVKLIMIDPKVVELSVYNGIPHLLIPVVTDPKKASAALNWAVAEMTERYKKFADLGVRDLKGYNEKIFMEDSGQAGEERVKLPQVVIIVDELADLMMVAPGEVEEAICRLAQLARAAGIHLIIATQRPSVNVITGVIKANVPSRIAFSVSSSVDSRTIIDGAGAEKLLGKGDMLFFPSGIPKPVRVQGAFVSDKEVSAVVEFLTSHHTELSYDHTVDEKIATTVLAAENTAAAGGNERDDYFAEAGRFIIEKDKASIGMLQRVYKIGFNRAARIMDQLCDAGVVGQEEGTKPRKVLMTLEEFEQLPS